MRLRAKEPQFDAIDGEYIVPVRFSRAFVHALVDSWANVGLGYMQLRGRPDGSYDMFIKPADASEEYNLVQLDKVRDALMAALDLANVVTYEEEEITDNILAAAEEVRRLVGNISNGK